MSKEKYEAIILELSNIDNKEEKIEYLKAHIERIDYDMNGYNDDLIDLLNRLIDGK